MAVSVLQDQVLYECSSMRSISVDIHEGEGEEMSKIAGVASVHY